MKFVKITTVLLSLIALLTGAMDVIVGVAGQANIGVGPAAAAPFDPVLDSQVVSLARSGSASERSSWSALATCAVMARSFSSVSP